MKTAVFKILLPALILSAFFASGALAERRDVQFHWSASPVIDDEGIVRPEAVTYEVWLKRGTASEQLVATVPDTTYKLSADSGISHQIRVRGVDKQGRRSVMSEWSDPFYFEIDGEGVAAPLGPQLKPNYPNPFNPETRIVYSIPEDIKSTDVVRLEIYSVQGYRVRILPVDRTPGWHEVTWNGKDQRGIVTSAGMYVTRLAVGDKVQTGKMTMVK
ncbi:MAG: hypothetical protein ABFS42_09305 [Candidatus Krumholzibacteriota bacterium]